MKSFVGHDASFGLYSVREGAGWRLSAEESRCDIPCTSMVFSSIWNSLGIAKMQVSQFHPRPMKADVLEGSLGISII